MTHSSPAMTSTVQVEAKPAPDASVRDTGTLRLGGLSPVFRPQSIADAGKLRLGGLSPIFQGR